MISYTWRIPASIAATSRSLITVGLLAVLVLSALAPTSIIMAAASIITAVALLIITASSITDHYPAVGIIMVTPRRRHIIAT